MSDERSPSNRSRALDALVEEVKDFDARALPPAGASRASGTPGELDWARLEERVMAAVEREKPAVLRELRELRDAPSRRAPAPGFSRDAWLRAAAVALAAAASVALFVRKDSPAETLVDPGVVAVDGASASSLRATEGDGEVRVNRVLATPGYVVRAGDTIDVDGTRAVFERTRKVTWLLEGTGSPADPPADPGRTARAHVKAAGESLVVGLESGAVEAQVTPVPTGEAFAVDVATDHGVVRVAVHGTHLRVARVGTHVTVDLTEGVVSIGTPPRTGVTYGTLVTAPAHVELDASDLRTLRVDHAPAAVRAAIPLGRHEAEAPVVGRADAPPPALLPSSPRAPTTVAVKGASPRSDSAEAPDPHGAAPAAGTGAPKGARDTIASAVRDCAVARGRSGDVHVTVTSNLNLHVSPGGEVESAQFSPPLLPDIQTCAAQAIYRTRLDETGLVTIPIEYSY